MTMYSSWNASMMNRLRHAGWNTFAIFVMKMGESNSRLMNNQNISGLRLRQICGIWNNVHTFTINADQSTCAMLVILLRATSKRQLNVLTQTSHIMPKVCAPLATKRYTTKYSASQKLKSLRSKISLSEVISQRRTRSITIKSWTLKILPKESRSSMEWKKSEIGHGYQTIRIRRWNLLIVIKWSI